MSDITGVFSSRESAEQHLLNKRYQPHNFGGFVNPSVKKYDDEIEMFARVEEFEVQK